MNREDLLIEPAELLARQGDPSLRIYDASPSDQQYRQGHIPGAAIFDHDAFSDPAAKYMATVPSETELAARIAAAGMGDETEVVFYAWGVIPYAARAWWLLRYAGHPRLRVLNAGLDAWLAAGGTLETEARTYAPGTFTARFTPAMFANLDEVARAVDDPAVLLVDVLPPVSYEGGHIPNSVCESCMDLMVGFDAFQPRAQLSLRLQDVRTDQRIITYCGGGIAAAVNAMAHLLVGRENVAVYDGSLDEWVGEGRPIIGNGKWAIWKTG